MGTLGPLFMTILGAISAISGGLAYGFAIFHCPYIYINFFLTIFFGAYVGFMVGLGTEWGKVRSSGFATYGGIAFGAIAVYFSWVVYFFAGLDVWILSPSLLWDSISAIAASGGWSLFGWTPKGFALYGIWAIEAGIIIFMSLAIAVGRMADTPFCEVCNKWVKHTINLPPLTPIENLVELKEKLEQQDFSILHTTTKSVGSPVFMQLNLLHCESCQDFYLLTLTLVVISVDSEGNESKQENHIVQNLIIHKDSYSELQQLENLPEAQPQETSPEGTENPSTSQNPESEGSPEEKPEL